MALGTSEMNVAIVGNPTMRQAISEFLFPSVSKRVPCETVRTTDSYSCKLNQQDLKRLARRLALKQRHERTWKWSIQGRGGVGRNKPRRFSAYACFWALGLIGGRAHIFKVILL